MPYVIFSLTQCNVRHMPTLLLQLWLGTGHETLLLGWATFGLLLNCLTIVTQLQQKTTSCVTDWTTFHCKYRTDRAKARPQKCCHVCYYQGIRNGKKPDSLSLPRCCPSQPSLPYHKKLCYCRQTTRRAVSVEILSTTAQLYEQVVQQIKVIELERHINRCVINYMCPSTTRQLS